MAIAFYNGQDERYCLLDQGTWGAAPTTNAAGQGIHVAEWDLKPTVNYFTPNRAYAQRYGLTTSPLVHEKGVTHSVAMPAIPALKDQLDKFLYAVVQNVSEGTGTPFAKTFTFAQTQPDFSVSGGHFETIVNQMPVDSTDHYLSDAILQTLTLSCGATANNGILTVEGTWVARNHSETFNYTGTITYPDSALTDFFTFGGLATKTIAGTGVILGDEGFKVTISNGAKGVGQLADVIQTFGLTEYSVITTVSALWDSTLRTSMASQRAGTAEALVLEWGTAGVDGHLGITINGKWKEPRDIAKTKDGTFVTLTHEALGVYGTTQPLSIVMSNAIDRAW